jgi:hypothetical protein
MANTEYTEEELKAAYDAMMTEGETPTPVSTPEYTEEELKAAYEAMMAEGETPTPVATPSPEPTPVPTPSPDDTEVKPLEGIPTPAPKLQPKEANARLDRDIGGRRYDGLTILADRNKIPPDVVTRIEDQLTEERKRRGSIVDELNKGGVYDYNPFEQAGAIGETMVKSLYHSSTRPSKVIDEIQARGTAPGERSPSVERALGSTVNVIKGLIPGSDTKLSSALKDWTIYEPEDARTKVTRIYSTPIINEYGRINKESLDYSDLDRDLQNTLSVAWAQQRTGLEGAEFWQNVISSRFGADPRNSSFQAALKRPLQSVDAATFNIVSKLYQKANIGSDIREARGGGERLGEKPQDADA